MRTPSHSDPPADRSLQTGNWQIAQLPGLSAQDCDRLEQAGIHTTLELLQQTQTRSQRQALASQLQTHLQHLNKWVALADLARVPSVGCQHCGLLLHAGISTPEQLAKTALPQLHRQILKLQVATLQRPDLCPSLNQMSHWIQQAQGMQSRPRRASWDTKTSL